MRKVLSICLILSLVSGGICGAADPAAVSFREHIAPVLIQRCLSCHGPKKAEGGYRVDTYEQLLKPGDSGEAPIGSSKEQVSELLRRLTTDDASERMPADDDALSAQQIDAFKRWIDAGAAFDGNKVDQSLVFVVPPARYDDPPRNYGQSIPITAIAYSPDGTSLVVGGYHELTIWNIADMQLVRRVGNLGQRVFALAFSPDGTTLAVGGGEPGRHGETRDRKSTRLNSSHNA